MAKSTDHKSSSSRSHSRSNMHDGHRSTGSANRSSSRSKSDRK